MSHLVHSELAFVFPGQGSQSVGMLAGLAQEHPEVAATFAEASAVLGYDLWDLVSNGPEVRLNATQVTQPAMLAAGVAAYRVWCKSSDARPAWMAGHSLGEYTALVCAEALAFADGIRLVAERARLMQEAVPADVGAMAAILNLTDEQVAMVCREACSGAEIVAPANFNAPGQVVVAGHKPAVERAIDIAKASGARRAVLLPVSVPSHCRLMDAAAEGFAPVLAAVAIESPRTRVLHNVDVASHDVPEAIRTALCQQLSGPVRWTDSMRALVAAGVTRFVECGPGKVLAGLNKRIVPDARTETLFDADSLAKSLELTA
jgi:[acyl-carrier-protein] S-malonyltransferase